MPQCPECNDIALTKHLAAENSASVSILEKVDVATDQFLYLTPEERYNQMLHLLE